MNASARLADYIKTHPNLVGKVVDFNPLADRLFHFDFTAANTDLNIAILGDIHKIENWINEKLNANGCRYGIGGYMEHRTIYARSRLFDTDDEPRRLHLGVDIWAEAGTAVYSPMQGTIHSFNDNNNFGDYGPTIIIEHNLDGLPLYSLYGHLGRKSLEGLAVGQAVHIDQKIGHFGNVGENGQWPPHLHFQLMFDMEGNVGDYPGVCRFSEKDKYIQNVPDPQLILRFPTAVNN
jgi:murein DD-endopeptidase MepM/ murein hydrolase activator NlpD